MRSLLIAALLGLVAGTAGATTDRPHLRVMDETPLVVRGTGFRPREVVHVGLVAQTTRRKDVVAALTGSFTVRFTVTPVQCLSVRSLVASGNRGSYAKIPLSLDCIPPAPGPEP
jgi:hypothetical protein